MATIKRFEEIKSWQAARELAKMVYSCVSRGPLAKDYGLKDQICRAAVSIGSNIAEGFSRKGNKEFVKFLWIAKGSASEVQSQLYVAKDVGYIGEEQFNAIYAQAEKCITMIYKFIKVLRDSSVEGERYK